MSKIFISYKSEDRDHAETLAKALEVRGHIVWWDRDLKAGSNYRDAIKKELKSCDVAIVIWTPLSVDSHWVLDEATLASERKKLLPVQIRRDNSGKVRDFDFPIGFAQLHAENLTDWDGEADARVIDKLDDNILAIANDRWREVVVMSRFAGRDAKRFIQTISTDFGGLPFPNLIMGSLGLSLAGAAVTALAFFAMGDPSLALTSLLVLPIVAIFVAVIRVVFQFVYVTSGRSSRQFFDSSFTLVFMFSCMASVFLISLVLIWQKSADLLVLLVTTPPTVLAILMISAIVRVAISGARLLFGRL